MVRQTRGPWHPGDTCPTKPSHPPPQKLALFTLFCALSSFPLLLWPLQYYEFSPCATFLSYILSSAPLQTLFLLPLLFFPKLLHPSLLIFAPQSQESVESQRLNVSPPVRILCSSLSFQHECVVMKCSEPQQWQTKFHSASGGRPTYLNWLKCRNIAF